MVTLPTGPAASYKQWTKPECNLCPHSGGTGWAKVILYQIRNLPDGYKGDRDIEHFIEVVVCHIRHNICIHVFLLVLWGLFMEFFLIYYHHIKMVAVRSVNYFNAIRSIESGKIRTH